MTGITSRIVILAVATSIFYLAEQYIERIGYDRATVEYQRSITEQKKQSAIQLANAAEKTKAAEQALQNFKNQQDLQDEKNKKAASDLSDRLRHAAGPAGRLRDPNATAGCGAGSDDTQGDPATPSTDRAAYAAQAGGLLSKQLTELLQQLTREADDINTAYASCRAYAYTVSCAAP